MNVGYGFDGYNNVPNQGYLNEDPVFNEIQSLKEKVKTTEERQTEQEYWNKLLESNIRSGTVACMWCIKAQILKKVSLAFYKWKYTSMMMNPSSSRKATPLRIRHTSGGDNAQNTPGHISAALESAVQTINKSKHNISDSNINNPEETKQVVSPVKYQEEKVVDSNQSIMSSVMDIQYNRSTSAHLNKYLQDTLVNKKTDFDTKRKILLAMSNDIIDRGQRERSIIHSPEKDVASVHSAAASTIRSESHSNIHHNHSSGARLPHTAPHDHSHHHHAEQSKSLYELARTSHNGPLPLSHDDHSHNHHQHHHDSHNHSSHQHHGLTIDLHHVGGGNAIQDSSSHKETNKGYSFSRSPARGRWTEHDPVPEYKPPADFKYLVFKNNDSGNYVKELLNSPAMSSHSRSRSNSANRTRTPPATTQRNSHVHHSGGDSVATGGSHGSMRKSVEQIQTTASSASVSSARNHRHDVRHRINTLNNSRISATSSTSPVPRYLLPTNSYIKKILSPEEAAQFSIVGQHLSGGMNRSVHQHHQQQKSMVRRSYESGGSNSRSPGNTFHYSGAPYHGSEEHGHHRQSHDYREFDHAHEQHHHSQPPTINKQAVNTSNDVPNTKPTENNINNNSDITEEPVQIPPHLSETTHRVLRQPHFVSGAVESLTGVHHKPIPHHVSVNYDEFYPPSYETQPQQRNDLMPPQFTESPHVQEYAELVYSNQSNQNQQQQQHPESFNLENSTPQGLYSSYADSRNNNNTDSNNNSSSSGGGYGFTYRAQQSEAGYVTSANYDENYNKGSYTSPGGHQYSHTDYDHYEGEYDVPEYNYNANNNHNSNNKNVSYQHGQYDSYYDEGPEVNTSNYSNTSYQSYQQQQGRRVFGTKKSSGGGSSVGSKAKPAKKPIDKAQMKLFYGHLPEFKDSTWSRNLRN